MLKTFLGAQDADGHRRSRVINILAGVVTAFANKALSIAISLASVPLTIGYLGDERYGVWVLVSSLLAWLSLADLGIGNGLTNSIASALGSDRHDLVKEHVSTAFVTLGLIAVLLGLLIYGAWPFIDWVKLFNVHDPVAKAEVGPAMAAVIIVFLLSFPLSVISRTMLATQNAKVANYWGAATNVANFVALLVVTRTEGGLPALAIAVSGTGLVVQLISGIWLFTHFKPQYSPHFRHARKTSARSIANVGIQFFVIQLLSLAVFQTDTLFVAHFLGAAQSPVYSLTYNLFAYTSIIQTTMFGYLWVAYADAIARGDISWVKDTFRKTVLSSIAITTAAVIPLIFIARPFITFWTRGAITPPLDLVLWMAAWCVVNSLCNPIACLLAAASHMKWQLTYGSIAVIANMMFSIYLIPKWGVSGAIAATVIAYIIFNCGSTIVDVLALIRRLEHRAGSANLNNPISGVSA